MRLRFLCTSICFPGALTARVSSGKFSRPHSPSFPNSKGLSKGEKRIWSRLHSPRPFIGPSQQVQRQSLKPLLHLHSLKVYLRCGSRTTTTNKQRYIKKVRSIYLFLFFSEVWCKRPFIQTFTPNIHYGTLLNRYIDDR